MVDRFSILTTRRRSSRAATCCCIDPVRTRAARFGSRCVDLARRGPASAALFVRPLAPVRRRPASRPRHRRSDGHERRRPGGGCRLLRRHGSDRREDRLDPDPLRLHRDARPPGLDRCNARSFRRRRLGRRHGRPERNGRSVRAVRVFRSTPDLRAAGLRGSADALAAPDAGRPQAGCDGIRRGAGGCRCPGHGRGARDFRSLVARAGSGLTGGDRRSGACAAPAGLRSCCNSGTCRVRVLGALGPAAERLCAGAL
jgi:hypothetical protein